MALLRCHHRLLPASWLVTLLAICGVLLPATAWTADAFQARCSARLQSFCPAGAAVTICDGLPSEGWPEQADSEALLADRESRLRRENRYKEALVTAARRLFVASGSAPPSPVVVGDRLFSVAGLFGWSNELSANALPALGCALHSYHAGKLEADDLRVLLGRAQILQGGFERPARRDVEALIELRPASVPAEMAGLANALDATLANLLGEPLKDEKSVPRTDLERIVQLRRSALAYSRQFETSRDEFVSYALDSLAVALTSRNEGGDLIEAEAVARSALRLKLNWAGMAHDSTATSYATLGRTLLWQSLNRGDDKSIDGMQFLRLAVLTLRSPARKEADRVFIMSRIAALSAELADWLHFAGTPDDHNEAIVFYKISVDARQRMREGARRLPFEKRKEYTRLLSDPYERLADLLQARGRYAEAQYVTLLLQEAETAQIVRYSIATEADQLAEIERQYVATVAEIERHANGLASGDDAALAKARDGIQRLVSNARVMLKRLAPTLGDSTAAVQILTEDSKRLQNALAAARAQDTGEDVVAVVLLPRDVETVAWLTAAESGTQTLSLPIGQAALRKSIDDLNLKIRTANPSYREEAQLLHRLLLARILAKVKTDRPLTLLIAAVGDVRRLPFAALIDEHGRHVVENKGLRVGYFDSASIPALAQAPAERWRIAAFGSSQSPGGTSLGALAHVKRELDSIVAGPVGSVGSIPGTKHFDPDFVPDALLKTLDGTAKFSQPVNVVHVASHFVIDPANWNRSFLSASGPSRFFVDRLDQDNLSLAQFQLITLSACGTEVPVAGAIESTSRTLGSRLLSLGANAVVGTLWNVNDAAAADLMTSFYAARGERRERYKLEALIKAQRALMSFRPEPFYWAPYVLIGNWR